MSENGDRPELPEGWEWATLGDVCEKPQYGYTTKAAEDGDLRFLRTTDIAHGPVEWDTVPFCAVTPDDPSKYKLRSGDLVISRAGSVGLSAVIDSPPDAVFASYLIRFRPKANVIDPQLLAWVLRSPLYWRAVSERASGIGMNNVNAKKFASIPIPLPPRHLQAQTAAVIASKLALIERGVADLDAAQVGLKFLGRRALEEALHLHAGDLPNGWQWKMLSEVAVLSSGGTPSRTRPEYFGPGVPWIKIGDLNEALVTRTEESVTAEGVENSSAEVLEPGAVMLAMYGASIGRTGVLGMRAATNQAICSMHADEALIRPAFLHLVLQANKAAFVAAGYGGAQPNISQRYLKSFSIPVPPLDVQAELLAALGESRAGLASASRQIEESVRKATSLRRSVLHSTLTGDLC